MSRPITKEMFEEIDRLTKPLRDWLKTNGGPHDLVTVESHRAEYFEGQLRVMDSIESPKQS